MTPRERHDIPWIVIIGAVVGLAILAIAAWYATAP
jgi:hypothetical protein